MNTPLTTPVSRRLLMLGSLSAVAVGAAACSTERTTGGNTATSSPGGGGATNDGVLTMSVSAPITQYYRNWNPFSPATNKGNGMNFFYEALLTLDRFNSNKPTPWLAKSWEVNADSTVITFTLQDNVKWSDGTPLTGEDVVYSLVEVGEKYGGKIVAPNYGIKEAKADGLKVTLTMKAANRANLNTVGVAFVYPKHIFDQQDLTTWTNPEPVGTGVCKLDTFTPQQVTVKVRDDYWGEKPQYVKTVKWPVFGNEDTIRAMLESGEADFTTVTLRDPKPWLARNKGAQYTISPTGAEGFIFNTAKAPFDDVHLRRAFSWGIDYAKVLTLFDTGVKVAGIAGQSEALWGDYIAPEYRGKTPQINLEGAKKELADGGWTVAGGQVVKGGTSHSISYLVPQSNDNWVVYAEGLAEQLKTNLGIELKIVKVPNDQWFQRTLTGDFDVSLHWIFEGTLPEAPTALSRNGMNKADIVPLGTAIANGRNLPRFENAEATAICEKIAKLPVDSPEVKDLVWQLQRISVDQVPSFAWCTGGNFAILSGKKWTGLPDVDSKPNWVPSLGGGNVLALLRALKPASK